LKQLLHRTTIISATLVAAAVALLGPAASAQCVLCYLSASATGDRGSSVLRAGILVLLIPTVLIFGGVMLLAVRRREPAASDDAVADHSLSEDRSNSEDRRDEEAWTPPPSRRENHSPSAW
jgi:hypothetical protein